MISLIWATDKNNLIGKNNDLPWHYKEDLQYFKKTTLNKTVVMGVNTFNSIIDLNKKPLPNRKNIVCSLTDFKTEFENVLVINDLIKYLKEEHNEEIFIIGGKTIFEIAFPYADRLYITHINKTHEGNVYFNYNLNNFKLIKEVKKDILNFCIYERIKK